MFEHLKTADELAAMVRQEAEENGKCVGMDLKRGFILSHGHEHDWRFNPVRSGASLSDECSNELSAIEKRLKERGFGLK